MYLTGDGAEDGLEAAVRLPPLPVPRPRHRVQRLIARAVRPPRLPGSARRDRAAAGAPAHRRGRRRLPGSCASSGRTRSSLEFDERRLRGRAAGHRRRRAGGARRARSRTARRAGSSAARTGPDDRRRAQRADAVEHGRAPAAGQERFADRQLHGAAEPGVPHRRRRPALPRRRREPPEPPAGAGRPGRRRRRRPGRLLRPPGSPRRWRCPGHRRAERARARHRAADARRPRRPPVAARPLRPALAVARPGDGGAVGRRGRARRRRPGPPRHPGRPRHVHQRRHPPAVPRCRHPPPGRADELRRRRRRLRHHGHRASPRRPRDPPHRPRRDGVRDLRDPPVASRRWRPPIRAAARATRVVVASAGNDATSRRTYPAALPGVVGVGALDGNRPAAFSNFGPWVDACAPAVDVVSTFFDYVDDRDRGRRARASRTAAGPAGAARASPRRRWPG